MGQNASAGAAAVPPTTTPSVSRGNSVRLVVTQPDEFQLGGSLVWGVSATPPTTFGGMASSGQQSFRNCTRLEKRAGGNSTAQQDNVSEFSGATVGDLCWAAWANATPAISGSALLNVAALGAAVT